VIWKFQREACYAFARPSRQRPTAKFLHISIAGRLVQVPLGVGNCALHQGSQ